MITSRSTISCICHENMQTMCLSFVYLAHFVREMVSLILYESCQTLQNIGVERERPIYKRFSFHSFFRFRCRRVLLLLLRFLFISPNWYMVVLVFPSTSLTILNCNETNEKENSKTVSKCIRKMDAIVHIAHISYWWLDL